MSTHIIQTIADLEKKVQEYEASSARVKATINDLCSMAGIPIKYAHSAFEKANTGTVMIRSDQFHARPVATIVREYLELRKRADLGPATIDEIFNALAEGGYEFKTKSDAIARISLNNALTKNPIFYKLPNKRWGLLEWYPKAKPHRSSFDESEDETEVGSDQANENRAKRAQGEDEEKAAESSV
jgi:hypothetical protein